MATTNRVSGDKILQSLEPEDALNILKTLIHENPDLKKIIVNTAKRVLNNVEIEDVTSDVFYELNALDVEDLYNRSGKTRYGYVEPTDESWEMFESVLTPFIDKMKQYQKNGMALSAKKYCIGIIEGLRKYEKESNSDFAGWVEDAPGEFIERVFDDWKKDCGNEDDIAKMHDLLKDVV